jgi:hypothetical protein
VRTILWILLILLPVPSIGLAQQYPVEITPMVGLRRAGGIQIEERAIWHQDYDVRLSSSGIYGIMLDLRVSRGFFLEVLMSRQVGSFDDKDGLFGEEPGGFVEPGERDHLNVEVLHYHGGISWEFGRGWSREYLVAGAGVTRIEPTLPLPGEARPSFNVGGGVKVDLVKRLGLRIDARYYWVDTDEEIVVVEELEHRDCEGPCTYTYSYNPSFSQGEISLGLIFRP